MASRGRPRRSNAPMDYTIAPLEALPSVPSDDETAASKPSRKSSPPPTNADPDDSDISAYDPVEEEKRRAKAEGREKGKGRESTDEDPNAESSDEESEAGSEPTASVASSPPVESKPVRKAVKPVNNTSRPRDKTDTPEVVLKPEPPRLQDDAPVVKPKAPSKPKLNRGPLAAPDAGFHPFYEPPVREFVDIRTDEDVDGLIVEDLPKTMLERAAEAKNMMGMPYGVERSKLQDMGWSMGKWNEKGMNKKWGGWYGQIKGVKHVILNEEAAEKYIPQQAYPAQKRKIHLDPPDDEESEIDDEEDSNAISIWLGSVLPKEHQKMIKIEGFESKRLDKTIPGKPGHIFNAGGPISGTAWLPRADAPSSYSTEYLAISTLGTHHLNNQRLSEPGLLQLWSLDTSVRSDLWRTTQEEKGAGLKFELGLCHEAGDAWGIAWCPRGGLVESVREGEAMEEGIMGIIGGAFTDGSISLFAVPHPNSVGKGEAKKTAKLYIEAKPILKLEIPDGRAISFAWGSHETIAGGYLNGHVAIWSVGEALRSPDSSSLKLRPIQCFAVHNACIRSIAYVQIPPLSDAQDGSLDLNAEPTMLVTGGYDGQTFLVDLKDPQAASQIHKERTAHMAVAYDSWTGAILVDDMDHRLRAIYIKTDDFTTTKKVLAHRGPIWSISTSGVHPFAASSAADGTVLLANTLRGARRMKATKNHILKKVFRIDFNRSTGEYRMIDNINYEERLTLEAHRKSKKAPKTATKFHDPLDDRSIKSWYPETGVYVVAWHPSMRRAGLLVSGMACGLGRIDWVVGTYGAADPAHQAVGESSESETEVEEVPEKAKEVVEEEEGEFEIVNGALVIVKSKPKTVIDDDEEDDAPLQRTTTKGKGKGKSKAKIIEDEEMDLENDWQAQQDILVDSPATATTTKKKVAPKKNPATSKSIAKGSKSSRKVQESDDDDVEEDVDIVVNSPPKKKVVPKKKDPVSNSKSVSSKSVRKVQESDDDEEEEDGDIVVDSPPKKKVAPKKPAAKSSAKTSAPSKKRKIQDPDDENEEEEDELASPPKKKPAPRKSALASTSKAAPKPPKKTARKSAVVESENEEEAEDDDGEEVEEVVETPKKITRGPYKPKSAAALALAAQKRKEKAEAKKREKNGE